MDETVVVGIGSRSFASYTEAGSAERFERVFGNDFKWCEDTEKWFRYDDETGLWSPTTKSVMQNNVAEMANILDQDKNNLTGDDREDVDKYIRDLRSLSVANATLEYSKARMSCKESDFDSNPTFIGLPDGKALNLITMQVVDIERDMMLTKTLNGNVKEEISEDFKKFIWKIFPDEDILQYVQKYLGSCLLGYKLRFSDDKQVLFIDSSTSDTGKSTLLSLLESCFGKYFNSKKIVLLTTSVSDGNKPAPMLAELRGARCVGISEVPPNATFAMDTFKALSGNDTVEARYPYDKRPFYFKPEFRLLIVSNELPRPANNEDLAFKTRFRRITFDKSIEGMDKNIVRKFESGDFRSDFVTWLIEGCKKYREEGLDDYRGFNIDESNLPQKMKVAIKKYFKQNDDIEDFFNTFYTITKEEKDFISFKDIYDNWASYTNEKLGFYKWCDYIRTSFKRLGLDEARRQIVNKRTGENKRPNCILGIKEISRQDASKEKGNIIAI